MPEEVRSGSDRRLLRYSLRQVHRNIYMQNCSTYIKDRITRSLSSINTYLQSAPLRQSSFTTATWPAMADTISADLPKLYQDQMSYLFLLKDIFFFIISILVSNRILHRNIHLIRETAWKLSCTIDASSDQHHLYQDQYIFRKKIQFPLLLHNYI